MSHTEFANFVLQDEEKYDDDSRDGHEEEEEGDHGKSEDEGEEGEFSSVEVSCLVGTTCSLGVRKYLPTQCFNQNQKGGMPFLVY